MSDLSPNYAPKPTSIDHAKFAVSRPGSWQPAFDAPACAAAPDLPVVPICRGPVTLILPPNHRHLSAHPVPQEGRIMIVTVVGAGCGGRLGDARRAAREADGEVVWSW